MDPEGARARLQGLLQPSARTKPAGVRDAREGFCVCQGSHREDWHFYRTEDTVGSAAAIPCTFSLILDDLGLDVASIANAELAGRLDHIVFSFNPMSVLDGLEGILSFPVEFCNIGGK
jgi:hypothetical protein